MRGNFITFEGGEGGGKSTQAARMAGYLRSKGLDVLETREPGGTPESEALRDLLVQGDPDRWSALSELLLITAARVEHVNRLIEPALAQGRWVICDRFADSTLAYQGIAGELGLELVEQLQELAVGATTPDVTFLLDLRAEAGLQRAEKRGGAARFEKKGAAFHQTLRDGFLALANENPQRIVLIDGEDSFDNVWEQIEAELKRRFKL
ncbi:MAG: dTMP kinase [Rhizobiales bacterium TMED83]|jgi:dTMP kinase|nr:dTMP kinase [Rhodobiaceae bacterium]RPF92199.1 MAG: dTMP kinase [Rhizobiales bacterium TMED83]HCD17280.1 dTMP kinase [Rhodobiaceae bacterium]